MIMSNPRFFEVIDYRRISLNRIAVVKDDLRVELMYFIFKSYFEHSSCILKPTEWIAG